MKHKIIGIIIALLILLAGCFAYVCWQRNAVASIIEDEAVQDSISFPERQITRLTPIPVHVNLQHLADGIYPVEFKTDSIQVNEDGMLINFDLYSFEFFDSLAINHLRPGDSIVVGGECYPVDSIRYDRQYILINGGLDYYGLDFEPTSKGTYRFVGMDDYTSYAYHGKTTLFIPNILPLEDRGNVEKSMEGVLVNGPDVPQYIKARNQDHFYYTATRIEIKDEKVVRFFVIYTP